MRHRLALTLMAVATTAGAFAPPATAPLVARATGFAGNGFMQAPGGPYLTDTFGRRLQLHGFNLVPKCPSFSKIATAAPGKPCIPDTVDHPGTPSYWLNPNPAYLAVDPDKTFTDADAAQLAGLGFNVARLGIIWRALELGRMATPAANDPNFCTPRSLNSKPLKPADDQLDLATLSAYLAHVDDTVNLLSAHGIYTMLDMHQDDYSEHFNNPNSATPWEGEGAPLWATCTNITGTTVPAVEGSKQSSGWAQNNLHDLALAMAADHFWSNDVSGNLQAQFIRVWQEVARHYRSNQSVIGYDPFNEPYDHVYTVVPTAFDSRLQCFYLGSADPNSRCDAIVPASQAPAVGVIPALLDPAVDPNHLIFYEPAVTTDYHGLETIGVGLPMNHPNLVLSFHVYPPAAAFGGGECTSPTCAVNDDLVVRNALQVRALTTTAQPGGPALFASEFGAEDFAPDLAHDADLFDGSALGTEGISWAYWSAHQNHDPTGQPNERLITPARQLVQPKGLALARAFARATAGTPTPGGQRYNPANAAFDFAYAPDHAITAPTEIVVPPLRYGGGYRVTVSGAAVISPCGANPVTLAADAPATAVTFHVEPGPGCPPTGFVTTVCNPASPISANNPCPPSPTLPDTAVLRTAPPAAAIELLVGLGLAAATVARRRRRKVRHP